MQKIAIISLILVGLGLQTASAQLTDQMVPHFGFMLDMGRLETNRNEGWNYSTLNVGSYISLFHAKDIVSLGIDPSVQLGLNFQGPGTRILVQTPVYAMVRLGAGATPYNQQNFGISLGAGAVYHNQWITINKARVDYLAPSFVGELTLVSRGSPLTGRIQFSPGVITATSRISGVASSIEDFGVVEVLSIGLLYGF